MIVLVCGGRTEDPSIRTLVRRVLDERREAGKLSAIVTGMASGVDTYATVWAKQNGVDLMLGVAHWSFYGASAGPIRNDAMLRICRVDLVLAFPGGNGTANMVEQAMKAGVPVENVLQ